MKAENIHTQRNHCAEFAVKKQKTNWNCQFNCSNCKRRTQKVNEKQTTKNKKQQNYPNRSDHMGSIQCVRSLWKDDQGKIAVC